MISVIVPAHNEEAFIGDCLQAIRNAEQQWRSPVEILVVLNRCTDKTELIAKEYAAVCIDDDSRCLSRIRNRGVEASQYPVIMTCDADSRLHPNSFIEVTEKLSSGLYVGGGAELVFDRVSRGIKTTEMFLNMMVKITGLACGAFWTSRSAFDAVGGFDENRLMGEDLDFAQRLAKFGKKQQLRYGCLTRSPLVTSSRKFDHFGDWSFFRMMTLDAWRVYRSMKKRDTEFVDEYFYDFNDRKKS